MSVYFYFAQMFNTFVRKITKKEMPRPKNERIVVNPPLFTQFKPVGIRPAMLKTTQLSLDEYEAIRLADFECFSHAEAADEMEISRSTFSRLIESARKKMATFLLQGTFLSISGGNVHFRSNIIRCLDCGHMFKTAITHQTDKCPKCNSTHLLNLAGGHGHGLCCVKEEI